VILGLGCSRCREEETRTSERDARKNGIAPAVNKTSVVIPTAAANTVVGGISNSGTAAGAVRATVKNAIADNGIATLRWTRNPISYPRLNGVLRLTTIVTRDKPPVCALMHRDS